jgi:hypothetical protein
LDNKTNQKCNPPPRPQSEKTFILKTQCYAVILQKLLFHGHYHWVK